MVITEQHAGFCFLRSHHITPSIILLEKKWKETLKLDGSLSITDLKMDSGPHPIERQTKNDGHAKHEKVNPAYAPTRKRGHKPPSIHSSIMR